MTRAGVTNAVATVLTSTIVRPRFLGQFQFAYGTVYLCTDMVNLSWNGQIYLGNGVLQGIVDLQETMDTTAPSYNVLLGGADQNILSSVLGQSNQTYLITIWLAFLDSSSNIIANPIEILSTEYDYATVTDDGSTPVITLTCSSELSTFKRVQERRYTPEWQKAAFPGDTGFDFAAQAADWSGYWGKAPFVPPKRKRRTGRN